MGNKTELVDETTNHMFSIISLGIDEICASDLNPIAEIFEIKNLMMRHLKDEKSSPQYQLQRYYPNIFSHSRRSNSKKCKSVPLRTSKKEKNKACIVLIWTSILCPASIS